VIYFADLVQKEIVNLEDPLFADLADTLALRKYSLGANFQSRFLDSLAVRDLQFEIGEGVWLRSNEANFQLEGRLVVNKTRDIYRIAGNLDVLRAPILKVGPFIQRTFTVERDRPLFRRSQRGARCRARHRCGLRSGRGYPGHRAHHRHAAGARAHAPSRPIAPR
jgi:hypothetical protein